MLNNTYFKQAGSLDVRIKVLLVTVIHPRLSFINEPIFVILFYLEGIQQTFAFHRNFWVQPSHQ